MKYPGGNPSTLFCEQVGTVTSLFEQWNDCERTVVMYALLKRIPYASLKFLQFSIECNLTQNFGSQTKLNLIEANANNPSYLGKLISTYKTFPIGDHSLSPLTSRDSALYESDLCLTDSEKIYDKKEDILEDVLGLLPLLRPGNDEAKAVYMSLIPLAVEDTVRQNVAPELVQQIFSYLLIHPAICNEDRRSLSQWLRHLEDHIHSVLASAGQQSFYILANSHDNSSSAIHSSANTSNSSLSNSTANTWQAIAPPSHKQQIQAALQTPHIISSSGGGGGGGSGGGVAGVVVAVSNASVGSCQSINTTASSLLVSTGSASSSTANDWDLSLIQIPQSFCDDIQLAELQTTATSQNSLGLIYDGASVIVRGNNSQSSNCNDDHHVSFSKNGTEIIDFDEEISNSDKSNTQIAFDAHLPSLIEHLNVPTMNNFCGTQNITANQSGAIKTRRSNSLTTPMTSSSSSSSSSGSCPNSSGAALTAVVGNNCSNSSENLAQFMQKPRSFSLSIESPRSSLTSSGSETRLDDFKPNYLKFTTHNIGMSNIAQWLKSLRLHKYVWLFTNITYEQMLDISEEYLQNLGVTKGASHKLALCIQKLKDRLNVLSEIEKDLIAGQIGVNVALEELTNIVLTPMKPVDAISKDNVAGQFLKVLDLVSQSVVKKQVTSSQDEDCINVLLWVLDRCIHSEAFVAHTNQLKEHKFKLSKIKMQFLPKEHYSKNNGGNGNLNKPRWNNNGKSHKSINNNSNNSGGNCDKNHRRNSNGIQNFNLTTVQQQQQPQPTSTPNGSLNNASYETAKGATAQQQQYFASTQQQKQPNINGCGVINSANGNNTSSSSNSSQYNKSSSYPNFSMNSSSGKSSHQQQQQLQPSQQQQQLLQQHTPQQQHYRHHRHSLNNLIVLSANPQQHRQITFKVGKPQAGVLFLNKSASASTNGNEESNKTGKPVMRKSSLKAIGNVNNAINGNLVTAATSASNVSAPVVLGSQSLLVTVPSTTGASLKLTNVSTCNSKSNTSSINLNGSSNIVNSSASICTNSKVAKESVSNNVTSSSSHSSPSIIINTSCSGNSNVTSSASSSARNTNSLSTAAATTIGDINSSLEFLCLQMTEQAIN